MQLLKWQTDCLLGLKPNGEHPTILVYRFGKACSCENRALIPFSIWMVRLSQEKDRLLKTCVLLASNILPGVASIEVWC